MTDRSPVPPTPPPSLNASPVGPLSGPEGQGLPVNPQAPDEAASLIPGPPAGMGRARGHRVRQRTGAWPAGGVQRVDPNSLESVSDDVAYWIESVAKDVSSAMMDGMYAPFAARITPDETARYYAETLFNPDGTLDPAQWWTEYARLGPDGLARAINGGAGWRRRLGLAVLLPTSKYQPTGVGPDTSGTAAHTPAGGAQPDAPDLKTAYPNMERE